LVEKLLFLRDEAKGLSGRSSMAPWRRKEFMVSEKAREKNASLPKRGHRMG